VIRKRQFDVTNVAQLIWNPTPHSGRIDLVAFGRKSRIDLQGYANADRLRMIRWFRRLIPLDKQQGWPLFCHKQALPLRRDLSTAAAEPLRPDEILITRRRYDVAAAVALPAALFVASSVWLVFAWPGLFLMLPVLAGAWLVVRFATPRDGLRWKRVGAAERRQMAHCAAPFAALLLALGVTRPAGVSEPVSVAAGIAVMFLGFAVLLFRDRQAMPVRNRREEIAALASADRWDAGEPGEFASHGT
jgi:hypothetical protein